ncbi:hypothetical protein NDU88_008313 [Pleurodeles waltl]|uniref:Uncharacterized protein n=1 Tax=Pleurodeles waltl TaxID=8319 RepID=A0AAV7N4N2_PLEWA|nr:hypothetical protein NDU88_008313 [Pleurodeles waltl]
MLTTGGEREIRETPSLDPPVPEMIAQEASLLGDAPPRTSNRWTQQYQTSTHRRPGRPIAGLGCVTNVHITPHGVTDVHTRDAGRSVVGSHLHHRRSQETRGNPSMNPAVPATFA